MPWKAPVGKGGVHVSRKADGSTGVKGMAPYDPTPPDPEDLRTEELARLESLMSAPPVPIQPYYTEDEF